MNKDQTYAHIAKRTSLFSLYIFHFQIVSHIFSAFNCVSAPVNGYPNSIPNYLSDSPWVICDGISEGSSYFKLFISALIFAILYLLLFFIGLVFLIWHTWKKKKRSKDKEKVTWFSFFIDQYKRELFFFEVIFLVKTTLLAIFFNTFAFDFKIQKWLIMGILIFDILLVLYVLPWARFKNFFHFFYDPKILHSKRFKVNMFQILGGFVLLITLVTLCQEAVAVTYIAMVLNIIFLLALFLALFSPSIREFLKSKRYKQIKQKLCCKKKEEEEHTNKTLDILYDETDEDSLLSSPQFEEQDIVPSDFEEKSVFVTESGTMRELLSRDERMENRWESVLLRDEEEWEEVDNRKEVEQLKYLLNKEKELRRRFSEQREHALRDRENAMKEKEVALEELKRLYSQNDELKKEVEKFKQN